MSSQLDGSRPKSVLVIGASQAAVQLASSLRELGHPGAVTIVGQEPHLPYHRPPLSKGFLLEDVDQEALAFRNDDFYTTNEITVVTDQRITSVVTNPDGSGHATSQAGHSYRFDRLALTVGARPRVLEMDGSDSTGILYLRHAQHAAQLKSSLLAAHRVLVVGGGFIGLEVAASARRLGRDVTVVLADDRVLNRSVGEPTSQFFEQAHAARGVRIHTSARPLRYLADSNGRVCGIELADGRVFEADVVVVGIGSSPRTELAESLGLATHNGITVDEFGVTSDGVTVAAGDCVNCPNPAPDLYGDGRLRFESVNAAVEQARSAAATLAGRPTPFRTIPWFWSDQYDLKLQVAGLSAGYDDFVLRGDPAGEKFTVLYYRRGRLIAADSVNRPADFVTIRQALSSGKTVPQQLASDIGRPLKSMATPLP